MSKTSLPFPIILHSDLRALTVREHYSIPKGDYEVGRVSMTREIGVFLVPKTFNQSADRRDHNDSNARWLTSMKRRFQFVETIDSHGGALLFPG